MKTCKRMEYLLLRQKELHIFTDNRNLQLIFDPRSVDNAIARYSADKLKRWSMLLQTFRYPVEHVAGCEMYGLICFHGRVDLNLTRSGLPGNCCSVSIVSNVSPLETTDFELPSVEETRAIQERALAVLQKATNYTKDAVRLFCVYAQERTWIPVMPCMYRSEFVSHLIRVQHVIVWMQRQWRSGEVCGMKCMKDDVQKFVKKFLHCMVVHG